MTDPELQIENNSDQSFPDQYSAALTFYCSNKPPTNKCLKQHIMPKLHGTSSIDQLEDNKETNDDEDDDHDDEQKQSKQDIKFNVNTKFASDTIHEKERKESKWDTLPIKCAGTIEIPRHFTQNIIPSTINENISNIYYFMDKSMALRSNRKILTNDGVVIINYDFHDKDTNEILYCIIKKQDPSKHRGFSWIMMNKLFTKKDISDFNVSEQELLRILPKSSRFEIKMVHQMNHINTMHDILRTQLTLGMVDRTQWHRIPVDNKTNNKQRKVLYLTKKEFMNKIEYFSTNDRNINIIPIMILNSNKKYWIEHIYIIKIDENIHIGISMKYKPHRNRIEVTGIHLNKQFILNKHQLAAPNHECHCLGHFISDIDDLKIGNIDEDKNRIKDLQKRHEIIKNENDKIKNENKRLKQLLHKNDIGDRDKKKTASYKKKYLHFKQFVQRFTNQKTPSSKLMTEAKQALDDDDTSPILADDGYCDLGVSFNYNDKSQYLDKTAIELNHKSVGLKHNYYKNIIPFSLREIKFVNDDHVLHGRSSMNQYSMCCVTNDIYIQNVPIDIVPLIRNINNEYDDEY